MPTRTLTVVSYAPRGSCNFIRHRNTRTDACYLLSFRPWYSPKPFWRHIREIRISGAGLHTGQFDWLLMRFQLFIAVYVVRYYYRSNYGKLKVKQWYWLLISKQKNVIMILGTPWISICQEQAFRGMFMWYFKICREPYRGLHPRTQTQYTSLYK